ncbi:MAG TPA: hypothetical protein VHS05_20570, partial [Pyrinomonadaceae bacterium]|nr:hypothetical protein [Pyrinomonadaceae bacterium]
MAVQNIEIIHGRRRMLHVISRWSCVCRFQSMFSNRIKFFVLLLLLVTSIFVVLSSENVKANSPSIPRVWDDAEMAALQLPLVDSTASPKQISSEYYYRIPVRTIYKNYPVYAPGKEPVGYFEWLKQQEPGSKDFRTLPDPSELLRNSDEQLYALALYIYSLKPPPNPNKFDRFAARGRKVFEREGCAV